MTIILKARQLGLTWLAIAYALWTLIFQPGSTVLLFSRRDEEATALLDRMHGMLDRLPTWLQPQITEDNRHELAFGGLGSRAQAFPTTKHSARSYTATLAIVDEADFIQWFRPLMNAVKPTIDAGGRLILLSTVDKETPDSEFKRLWMQAQDKDSSYHPIFLPWSAHPERDQAWYEKIKHDYLIDDLYQEYPASPAQALAPRQAAKRFHPDWLDACYQPAEDQEPDGLWAVYAPPQPGRQYLLAADPAEGSPRSDPSPATIFDTETWEEVAHLHGKFEPDILAGYLVAAARRYNDACVCVERNNHGHACQLAIEYLDAGDLLYRSPFDDKDGWLSNLKYKTLAVDNAAQVMREAGVTLHTEATTQELAMFEAATLKAPQGFTDDRAMTLIIGLAALRWPSTRLFTGQSAIIHAEEEITEEETSGW